MSQLAPTPRYPNFKFDTIGKAVAGTIVFPPEDRQALEYGTRKPKFWPDGNPVMQTKIVLETPADGRVAVYAQGRMVQAIRAALAEAEAADVEVGGTLAIKYSHDGEAKAGGQPPKMYEAKYQAPEGGSDWPDPSDLD